MAETTCPMTHDGLHRKKPWQAKDGRSGLACEKCHKTWTWRGDVLVSAYQEADHGE